MFIKVQIFTKNFYNDYLIPIMIYLTILDDSYNLIMLIIIKII